jgi:F0F1-type ATP synthase membrane subunit b/b'
MTMQREDDRSRKTADFQSAKSEVSERFEQEARSASEALHDARDELTRKAGGYASEAKQVVFDTAEGTQRDLSANLKAFGGALRAASEHLANSDQRTASKFAVDAAGGLERLSSSLKDKPFEEVLGEIQLFGRENSGALIAGSVLAGLALGRFIKSSAPTGPTDTRAGSQTRGGSATSPDEPGSSKNDSADASLEQTP